MRDTESVPYIWSVPEENVVNKEAKNLFEEMIAENILELRKSTKPWFKKPDTPREGIFLRRIVKLHDNKYKILKATEKRPSKK